MLFRFCLLEKVAVSLALRIIFGVGFAYGNVDDSIAYINEQLRQGNKVAIMLIDMQPKFISWFGERSKFFDIIHDQMKLLNAFSESDNVVFLDVNYLGYGDTFSGLLAKAKYNQNYFLVLKSRDSAFKKTQTIIRVTVDAPGEREGEVISHSLDAFLKGKGVKHIFAAGCLDRSCVFKTVKGAVKKDYFVTVDRDLNVVIRNGPKPNPGSYSEQLAKSADMWDDLQARFPKLKVIEPERYNEPCLTDD